MQTMVQTARDKAILFFYEHVGGSYNPATETVEQGKMRGAMRLADAEAWASAAGWRVEWHLEDEDPRDVFGEFCTADPCTDEHCGLIHSDPDAEHFWACIKGPDGERIDAGGSLGMIESPSREYRRLIEAELALEAMPS